MNLIDIETYTRHGIPTVSITNDLLIKPKPPVKMKEGRIKPTGRPGGGNRSSRPGNRAGKGPGSHRGSSHRRHNSNKKAV
jgi:hypothetical protein